MSEITVRHVRVDDHDDWRPLFEGYADFYRATLTDAVADRVWAWLLDPQHVLEGLIARDSAGHAVGIAHVRACPRPLAGRDMGFLDDLYVDPAARGSGAADALMAALADLAAQRGWPVIRWLTQEYNYRGRAFYDRYTGGRSDFLMYQWAQE